MTVQNLSLQQKRLIEFALTLNGTISSLIACRHLNRPTIIKVKDSFFRVNARIRIDNA
jgi:hypothetical protein